MRMTSLLHGKKPTLLTLSFGNHIFANYHFLKHPLTNRTVSSFYIPKVLKSAAKIMEIGLRIKIKGPIIIWTRAFSIVKMLPGEVTIFPQKIKFLIFHFRYNKSMPNIKIFLNEVQKLEQSNESC